MNILGYVSCYIATVINLIILLYCYSKIKGEKLVFKLKQVLLVMGISIIVVLINMYITTFVKFILVYFLLFLLFYLYSYNERKVFNIIVNTLIIYVLMIITDVFSSIILMQFDLSMFADKINLLKALGTILNSISMFILFSINFLVKYLKKLLDLLVNKKNTIITIFCFLSFIVICVIDCFHHDKATVTTFMVSILMLVFSIVLICILFYQYFKRKTLEEEKKELLVLMHEYENIVNQTSENRHEMLNDLLILKSMKDKNSIDYSETLDSIIRQYDTKKFVRYTNLAKLPTGVKGIIYYKMAYIKESDINFSTVVNNIDYAKFESMDKELYYKVCKILGILMDNAIEACSKGKEKKLIVSVYNENGMLCVEIDNDYIGEIDMENLYVRGYSTKSRGRGHGLYIVNKIISETDILDFRQFVTDNIFSSILIIKL